MLKRLAVIAAFFTVATAAVTASVADEQKLLKLLPAQHTVVLSFNAEEWLTLSNVRRHLDDDEEIANFRKSTGLQTADISAAAAWFRESDGLWTLLLAWKKSFNWQKLFVSTDKIKFTPVKIAGYNSWQVNVDLSDSKAKAPAAVKKLSFVIVALTPDILCITENIQDTGNLLPLLGKDKGVSFSSGMKGSFRGHFKSHTPVPGMPGSGELSLGLSGKQKKDLNGLLLLTCSTTEDARQLNAQALVMINMGLSMGMPDNPELAGELIRCIKCSTSGRTFSIKIDIPASLMESMINYATKKVNTVPAAGKTVKGRK